MTDNFEIELYIKEPIYVCENTKKGFLYWIKNLLTKSELTESFEIKSNLTKHEIRIKKRNSNMVLNLKNLTETKYKCLSLKFLPDIKNKGCEWDLEDLKLITRKIKEMFVQQHKIEIEARIMLVV